MAQGYLALLLLPISGLVAEGGLCRRAGVLQSILSFYDIMAFEQEIERRRTFAIISHPDAGKTTLTEKLLLFGGAIHVAGAVKSNKIKKSATSDWMEIEKQRGISVATSVMGFEYRNFKINILDTPGHQGFAENGSASSRERGLRVVKR